MRNITNRNFVHPTSLHNRCNHYKRTMMGYRGLCCDIGTGRCDMLQSNNNIEQYLPKQSTVGARKIILMLHANQKLSCRRGTARRSVSVESCQLPHTCKKYLLLEVLQ